MTLISRIDIRPDCIEISVRRSCLVKLLAAQAIDLTTQDGQTNTGSKDVLTLTVMARLQRVGREMKMLVENTDDQTTADPGLLRIVARAHDIQERLMQNTDLTVHAIASQEHLRTTSIAFYAFPRLRRTSSPPSSTVRTATTHRQEADATDTANTGRLG